MNAKSLATTAALLATAAPALAAPIERVDHSGVLVWAFLGMCALIIVAQVFPAVLLVLGLVKGLVRSKAPEETPTR